MKKKCSVWLMVGNVILFYGMLVLLNSFILRFFLLVLKVGLVSCVR